MKFNRKTFFDGFRERLDSTISQEQVEGLEFLLGQFETDSHWKDIRHIAYAFATIFHETAYSFQPVEEGYYLGSKARVQKFQKTLRYYPYFGRGYVQLTWKNNYEKAGRALGLDLVNKPELALQSKPAFDILTLGLFRGWYGGKLTTYINDAKTDYVNARRCVNVLDKAGVIAGYARSFEKILRASLSTAEQPQPNTHGHKPLDSNATTDSTTDSPTPVSASPSNAINTDKPASLIPTPTAVVEVETVSAAPTETPPAEESTLTKLGNKANAAYTAFGTVVSGAIAWFSGSPVGIVAAVMGCVAILGVTYMVINALRANGKEKRDQAAKLELARIAAEERQKREDRAHQIQLKLMEAASCPDRQTIRLVPPPPVTELPNSETNL